MKSIATPMKWGFFWAGLIGFFMVGPERVGFTIAAILVALFLQREAA